MPTKSIGNNPANSIAHFEGTAVVLIVVTPTDPADELSHERHEGSTPFISYSRANSRTGASHQFLLLGWDLEGWVLLGWD